MKLEHFKNILELVSTSGLITEFIIKKDGTVKQKSVDNTFMVDLKHKNISLEEDIGIDDTTKLRNVVKRFSDNAEVSTDGKVLKIIEGTKRATIPLINVEEEKVELPSMNFTTIIENVDLQTLRNAVNNRIKELNKRYVFFLKDRKLYLRVGDDESGKICDMISEVDTDSTDKSTFGLNVKEVVDTLKGNPMICMGNNYPMKFRYETEDYEVEYILAPVVDEV